MGKEGSGDEDDADWHQRAEGPWGWIAGKADRIKPQRQRSLWSLHPLPQLSVSASNVVTIYEDSPTHLTGRCYANSTTQHEFTTGEERKEPKFPRSLFLFFLNYFKGGNWYFSFISCMFYRLQEVMTQVTKPTFRIFSAPHLYCLYLQWDHVHYTLKEGK